MISPNLADRVNDRPAPRVLASRSSQSKPSALVVLLDDWRSRGIAFVTLGKGIDTSTQAGRLVAGVLGSIAEFESSSE